MTCDDHTEPNGFLEGLPGDSDGHDDFPPFDGPCDDSLPLLSDGALPPRPFKLPRPLGPLPDHIPGGALPPRGKFPGSKRPCGKRPGSHGPLPAKGPRPDGLPPMPKFKH